MVKNGVEVGSKSCATKDKGTPRVVQAGLSSTWSRILSHIHRECTVGLWIYWQDSAIDLSIVFTDSVQGWISSKTVTTDCLEQSRSGKHDCVIEQEFTVSEQNTSFPVRIGGHGRTLPGIVDTKIVISSVGRTLPCIVNTKNCHTYFTSYERLHSVVL